MFFYIVRNDAVTVLTVFHAAQNFPDLIDNKLQAHPDVSVTEAETRASTSFPFALFGG
jgi:hypothetical protein